ncbi:hypothetical protein PF010_g17881 [Phytophthora fragariae]|uniref:Uncharacterized protein n=1 Tax=Phytophthora fragariae TaxID=53985 RepID=A0A6G0KLT0_9STRA|nr:hypothetical protein PF010_g17881 [Phytophthora fragariae]
MALLPLPLPRRHHQKDNQKDNQKENAPQLSPLTRSLLLRIAPRASMRRRRKLDLDYKGLVDWIKVEVNFKAINDTDKRLKVGGPPETGECYSKVKPY